LLNKSVCTHDGFVSEFVVMEKSVILHLEMPEEEDFMDVPLEQVKY